MQQIGTLRKMQSLWVNAQTPIAYEFKLNDIKTPLNQHIGQKIKLQHTGNFHCVHCGKAIKKTFQQGYCYPCTLKLAETDFCILKPELCHHHMGTCRDNEFAQQHCFITHTVYLANCGSEKVGITRSNQKFTRWSDQGASAAIELAAVPNRKVSGDVEVFLKNHISDRTNWRKMLSTDIPFIDLAELKKNLVEKMPEDLKKYL